MNIIMEMSKYLTLKIKSQNFLFKAKFCKSSALEYSSYMVFEHEHEDGPIHGICTPQQNTHYLLVVVTGTQRDETC